jgi:general stress protein YciG
MDPEEQRRIASEGGRASHESGRGHEWNSSEAREAGRKGGMASHGGGKGGSGR